MISTIATRATRTPMTAPSAVLLILVVLSSCEDMVVMVRVFDDVDTLFVAVVDDCVTVAVLGKQVQIPLFYYLTNLTLFTCWL